MCVHVCKLSIDLHKVLVLLCVPLQAESPEQVLLATLNELIEDVEVSFSVALVHNTRFLQQVVYDVTPNWSTLPTRKANGSNSGRLTSTNIYVEQTHTSKGIQEHNPIPRSIKGRWYRCIKSININISDAMLFMHYLLWVINSSTATNLVLN